VKKEESNDPKTWEFELNINKHINKRSGIIVFILLLLVLIVLIMEVVLLTKNLGSVEAAIRIVLRSVSTILLAILFVGWIFSKIVRKKYWPIIVVPVIALIIVIFLVNNYPNGGPIQRNDILSFAGDYLSFLERQTLSFVFLRFLRLPLSEQ